MVPHGSSILPSHAQHILGDMMHLFKYRQGRSATQHEHIRVQRMLLKKTLLIQPFDEHDENMASQVAAAAQKGWSQTQHPCALRLRQKTDLLVLQFSRVKDEMARLLLQCMDIPQAAQSATLFTDSNHQTGATSGHRSGGRGLLYCECRHRYSTDH